MIKGEANLLEEGACMVQIYTIVIPLIRVAHNHYREVIPEEIQEARNKADAFCVKNYFKSNSTFL